MELLLQLLYPKIPRGIKAFFVEDRRFIKQAQVLIAEFTLDRLANGRCRARVGLTWRDSEQFTGEGEGLASQAGELRCAAQACVIALGEAVQGGMKFELLGVKAVRAFDSTVIIVSLAVHGEGNDQRVVGSYLTENDTARGAALDVLNATNRILGNRLFMR